MKNLFNTIVGFVKLHKKIVIISLASFVGVCLVVAGCLLIPWGAGSTHFLVNTVNELFIDTDELLRIGEKLAENGYRSRIDFKLDGEEANRTSDVSIQMETLGYGDGDDLKERMDYLIKVDENEHGGGIAYADGKLYVIGYDKDQKQFCLYMPLDNILEELEGSIFAPTSDSKFAMSEDAYNQIKSALEGDDDDATEELREFYNRLLPKIKDQIKQKTVIADKNTVAITLEEETLKKLIEIAVDELKGDEKLKERLSLDDEALDKIKKQLNESVKGYTFELTYTVEKNMLRSAHLSVEHNKVNTIDNIEYDLQITTEKNRDALTLTMETTTGPSHNRVTDSASLEYVRTEEKGKTNTTLTFTSKPHEGEEEMFYFTLAHYTKDGDYRLEYYSSEDAEDPDMLMEGKAGFYKNRGGYFFSIDKYVDEDVSLTDLISFYTKLDKAGKQLTMPEGENFLDITEERLDAIIAGINFAGMDKSLFDSLGKNIHLSEDGLPISNYTVALNDAEAIKILFDNYRKKTECQNVTKIYYYDEACGVYILCTYTGRYFTKFYTFPGKLLDDYHEAKIVNGTFIVHEYEITEEKVADCLNEGYKIRRCVQCGVSYKSDVKRANGHTEAKESIEHTYDIGKTDNAATVKYCSVCGRIISFVYGEDSNFSLYFYDANPYKGMVNSIKHLVIPDELCERFGLQNIVLSFNSASSILSINVPDGREVIASGDFASATMLQVLALPTSIKEIQDGSFYAESNLHTIFYHGTEEMWQRVELNGYETLWENVKVICLPDGFDAEMVMEACIDITKANIELINKKNLTNSIGSAANLAAESDCVGLFYNSRLSLASYDGKTDIISIALVSGGKTYVKLYHSNETFYSSFEINDEVGVMDSDGGVIAMASKELSKIYIYDIAEKSLTEFHFTKYDCYFTVIFVDGSNIIFEADEKRTTGDGLYLLTLGGELKEIGSISGGHSFYFVREDHLLLACDYTNNSLTQFDTTRGKQTKNLRISSISNDLFYKYGYFYGKKYTDSGTSPTYCDYKLKLTDDRPEKHWAEFCLDSAIEVKNIMTGYSGRVIMAKNTDGELSLVITDGENTISLDYYAERGFVLNDGRILLYTPGGYGILSVAL